MHQNYIDNLLQKYLDGTCSEQERQKIELWLLKRGSNKQVSVDFQDEISIKDLLFNDIKQRIYVEQQVTETQKQQYPLFTRRFYTKNIVKLAAAAIIVIVGLAFYLDKQDPQLPNYILNKSIYAASNTEPVPQAYQIRIAGKAYLIDSLTEGATLQVGGIRIQKNGANSIAYSRIADEESPENNPTLDQVSVPSGRDLHLQLADGSKIWINTETTLMFPTYFNQDERHLFLTGEAFFEVASDKKHPFIVESKDFQVTATGTQFAVSAYADDEQRSTTLVEGQVAITTAAGNKHLYPNQQWSSNKSGIQTIEEVDVQRVLGNRDGYFVFDEQNIQQIMKQVSRWYNIEISYEGHITDKQFGGTFSRTRSLDELIDYLSTLGGFKIIKEGRRVIIMS